MKNLLNGLLDVLRGEGGKEWKLIKASSDKLINAIHESNSENGHQLDYPGAAVNHYKKAVEDVDVVNAFNQYSHYFNLKSRGKYYTQSECLNTLFRCVSSHVPAEEVIDFARYVVNNDLALKAASKDKGARHSNALGALVELSNRCAEPDKRDFLNVIEENKYFQNLVSEVPHPDFYAYIFRNIANNMDEQEAINLVSRSEVWRKQSYEKIFRAWVLDSAPRLAPALDQN